MKHVRNFKVSHTKFLVLCVFGFGTLFFMDTSQNCLQKFKLLLSRNLKDTISNESTELAIQTEVKHNCKKSDFLGYWANNLACNYFKNAQKYSPYLSETLEMNQVEQIRLTKNANSLCAGQEVDLVVVVHTAPSHFLHRNVIRNTWGGGLQNLHKTVKVAFILGESMVEKVNEELRNETARYSDMIVVEMLDEYHKLTLKAMLLFRWARDFCPQASFIMKCDDDIVVNPLAYSKVKDEIMTPKNSFSVSGLVYEGTPERDSSKWGIPFYYYPFNWIPPFPLGPAVIVGKEASLKYLELSKIVSYLGIDDFFIFGILTSLGNITRFRAGNLVYGSKPKNILEGKPTFAWLTSGPNQMEEQWKTSIAPLMNATLSS